MTNRHRIDFQPVILALAGFVGAIVVVAFIAFQLSETREEPQLAKPKIDGASAEIAVDEASAAGGDSALGPTIKTAE